VQYFDNREIELGDIVELDMPGGRERARVVMLGCTYEHLELKGSFESWVKGEKILQESAIVIEWIGENPLAHNDPSYAPVGNYMFTDLHEYIKLIGRVKSAAPHT